MKTNLFFAACVAIFLSACNGQNTAGKFDDASTKDSTATAPMTKTDTAISNAKTPPDTIAGEKYSKTPGSGSSGSGSGAAGSGGGGPQ